MFVIVAIFLVMVNDFSTSSQTSQDKAGVFVYDVVDSTSEWQLILKAEEIRRNATKWGVFKGMRTWLKIE